MKAKSVGESFLSTFFTNRYIHGRVGVRKITNLPTDILSTRPHFAYVGWDMFGPFLIKQPIKEVKRYPSIFTSL